MTSVDIGGLVWDDVLPNELFDALLECDLSGGREMLSFWIPIDDNRHSMPQPRTVVEQVCERLLLDLCYTHQSNHDRTSRLRSLHFAVLCDPWTCSDPGKHGKGVSGGPRSATLTRTWECTLTRTRASGAIAASCGIPYCHVCYISTR